MQSSTSATIAKNEQGLIANQRDKMDLVQLLPGVLTQSVSDALALRAKATNLCSTTVSGFDIALCSGDVNDQHRELFGEFLQCFLGGYRHYQRHPGI